MSLTCPVLIPFSFRAGDVSGPLGKDFREGKMVKKSFFMMIVFSAFCFPIFASSSFVYAHCDTLGGPVVAVAKQALEKGDVTPVLKWVKKENEGEIRAAFKKTLTVRSKGPEARELADMYFFETLVRLHRAGEGPPIRVFLRNPWSRSSPPPTKRWKGGQQITL